MASSNKCLTCLTSSSKKLVETSASLLVTSACIQKHLEDDFEDAQYTEDEDQTVGSDIEEADVILVNSHVTLCRILSASCFY